MEYRVRIYGDNILECERALSLIETGVRASEGCATKNFILGNLIVPSFQITGRNTFTITLFPGVNKNRWNTNIYEELVTGNGGSLSEGADAIYTIEREIDGTVFEVPVLAIEFSSALPAGNNSWQRSGRALSFSQAEIPYIYTTEIGGNELDSSGEIKATRWPSSALILSYILNSERKDILSLIHYSLSPVANDKIKEEYSFLKENTFLPKKTYDLLVGNNKVTAQEQILQTSINIYNKRACIEENYFTVNAKRDINYPFIGIHKQKLPWNKIVSIPTSESFSKLRKLLSELCYSPYSKASLPFGVLPKAHSSKFTNKLKEIYSNEQVNEISKLIDSNYNDVVFVLVNGFKPSGEDSRPDRGILPFVQMLLGEKTPIVTVVFGPVPDYHLEKLAEKNFSSLSSSNGLFSAIFAGTDYLIIDTLKKGNQEAFFLKNSLKNIDTLKKGKNNFLSSKTEELPIKIGENDVDTLIHMFFEHGFPHVFESFSNPPGGDWSGISILKGGIEYRWVSLPRAPEEVKRPDHIFQIDSKTLLSIESKDCYNTLLETEKNVGPNMIAYLEKLLFTRPVNSYRKIGEQHYNSYNKMINMNDMIQLTSATFVSKNNADISFKSLYCLRKATSTDMVFGIKVVSEFDIKIYFYSTDSKITKLLESTDNVVISDFGVVSVINTEKNGSA